MVDFYYKKKCFFFLIHSQQHPLVTNNGANPLDEYIGGDEQGEFKISNEEILQAIGKIEKKGTVRMTARLKTAHLQKSSFVSSKGELTATPRYYN